MAYWLLPFPIYDPVGQRLGAMGNTVSSRIEVKRVIHAFEKKFPGQTRGVPPGEIIEGIHYLDKLSKSELLAARNQATKKSYIKMTPPQEGFDEGNVEEAIEAIGLVNKDITDASLGVLPPFADIASVDWSKTVINHESLYRRVLKALCAARGISYTRVTGDLTNTSFSSAKFEHIKDEQTAKSIQNLLIGQVLLPIIREWVEFNNQIGVFGGKIDVDKVLKSIKWHRPHLPSATTLEDAKAYEIMLMNGLTTQGHILGELGTSYEEFCEHLAENRLTLVKAFEDRSLEPPPNVWDLNRAVSVRDSLIPADQNPQPDQPKEKVK